MITPQFTFDAEANGYLSEPFELSRVADVHMELAAKAPVVTLKNVDGEWMNFGQTPSKSDRYRIRIRPTGRVELRLAVPVEVNKCFIIENDETV